MRNTEPAVDSGRRRGRSRKVESYSDWMARIDAEVDAAARATVKEARKPPATLCPAQHSLVEMLIEYLHGLPELTKGENALEKEAYFPIQMLLFGLFSAKYPEWAKGRRGSQLNIKEIPNGDGRQFEWMLYNCAGPGRITPVANKRTDPYAEEAALLAELIEVDKATKQSIRLLEHNLSALRGELPKIKDNHTEDEGDD
jgi:hypothetical protein